MAKSKKQSTKGKVQRISSNHNKSSSKNKGFTILMVALILIVLGIALVPRGGSKEKSAFKKEGTLNFSDASGKELAKIDMEVADNDNDRRQGLMFRKTMKESRGMLFVFDVEEPQSFWMKNTDLSLDIIYVNSQKEIVKIFKNTKPYSVSPLPSGKPALYVVEVNAGYTEKYGIKEGDKINFNRL